MEPDQLEAIVQAVLERQISERQLAVAALYIMFGPPAKYGRISSHDFFAPEEDIRKVAQCRNWLDERLLAARNAGKREGYDQGSADAYRKFRRDIRYKILAKRTRSISDVEKERAYLEGVRLSLEDQTARFDAVATEWNRILRLVETNTADDPRVKKVRDRLVSFGEALMAARRARGVAS